MKFDQVFIVAELSANHNHNFKTAVDTIHAAKEAGADAIKIQTYTADTMTINCDKDCFIINHGTPWDGKNLYQLYLEAYTPWEWQPELKKIAEGIGLAFFSTPFDRSSVDFLDDMGVELYKIASFEITDIPLIEYVASKKKPVILSTGLGTLAGIEEAVNACRRMGNNDITLLKCTSAYPAPVDEANLKTMLNMAETFNVKVGLSDHTMGHAVAVAAVALGARVIEKHFIINRNMGGPDAIFSMEPAEFQHMTNAIRDAEKALGVITYELTDNAKKNQDFTRSLFVVQDMEMGEVFRNENIRSIRPGYGMHPRYLKQIVGKKSSRKIDRGTPMSWDLIHI